MFRMANGAFSSTGGSGADGEPVCSGVKPIIVGMSSAEAKIEVARSLAAGRAWWRRSCADWELDASGPPVP